MRDFFRGWRRKVGCVALGMACVLMGMWLRSLDTWDFFAFPAGERHHQFNSIGGGCIWCSWKRQPAAEWASPDWQWIAEDAKENGPFGEFVETWNNPTNRSWKTRYWYFYYWQSVIPLTLLSAYLILWKSRTKPKNTVAELPQAGV